MRDRLYYSRSLPTVRGGRTRTLALRDATPTAVNWNDMVFTEGGTYFGNPAQMVGFTNQLTIRPQRNSLPAIVITCNVSADSIGSKIVSSTNIPVGGTQLVSVSPGQYVFFYASCDRAAGPLTVSVSNYITNAVIDTFTITVFIEE